MDTERFRPPDDRLFQDFLRRTVLGEIPVYGTVIDTTKVVIRRRFEDHGPEDSDLGEKSSNPCGTLGSRGNADSHDFMFGTTNIRLPTTTFGSR